MPKATDYDKKTPREHVLARPDTYIGDIEKTTEKMDVYNITTSKIENREIQFVPGLFKCYDELIVNSRDAAENDSGCDTIKINYNTEEGYIEVYNNGDKCIPVEEHPKFNTLVPTMIFGELLTSSNYDDSVKRTTGGRNGYGAKCANIFSTQFEVEIGDGINNKKFHQVWTENMSKVSKAKITKYSKTKSYVTIKFYPDLKRFGLDKLDNDHMMLFHRRAFDIAATSSNKLKVYFNDVHIKIDNFKKYISLYYPEDTIYYDDSNARWTVGCIFKPHDGGKTISFVNGISTYKGGTHINHITDVIIKPLIDNYIKKKNKEVTISPIIVKQNLIFFVNCIVENPSFGSQTKDTLNTKISNFGSKYSPNEQFLKKLAKCGIIDMVINYAKFKESEKLTKTDGKKQTRITGIPKLEDADKAGTKESSKCALILTEGDSAKTFAMSGLSIIGRTYYGVFPLKGKLLNIREATLKQKMENEEINNLKKIIGLKQNCKYETEEQFNTLRYGRIICLTDQDVDGSHIKGLLMNLFHTEWSELLRRDGFITSLATPIVKAFKGNTIKVFYNMIEFEDWANSDESKGYKTKYYKGLGTSSAKEAKECFKDIKDKLITYFCGDPIGDSTIDSTDDAITLAFEKARVDDRKDWLLKYDRKDILNYTDAEVSYYDFIHKDMIHFSNDDNMRSIPHIMDGLKPSQRKCLYGAILRGLDKEEIKVSQLAGFVSDKAAYHHGETSLTSTIVGMAQDYIGSNNINILMPNGGFGTRLQGGKDAASPRYIFTELSKPSISIFKNIDNVVLNYLEDDGLPIEPEYYAPIIPMILVNGCKGIGTGFSTDIPNYNPIDIIRNILRMMNGDDFEEMIPYYKNFTGSIVKVDSSKFTVQGNYSIVGDVLTVTELPVGEWTQNYKEFLEKLLELNSKNPVVLSYKNKSTDEKVHFEIKFKKDYLETEKNDAIMKKYHLEKTINLTNMHLYCVDGHIKKYNTIEDIMEEYYDHRLELYENRRTYYLDLLKYQLELLEAKVRFILMIVEKKLIINNRKKDDIENELNTLKFPKFGKNKDDTNINYNYLLTMPLYSLTYEKIEELKNQMKNKELEYNTLLNMTAIDVWKKDLKELLEVLDVKISKKDDINKYF